MKKYLLEYIVMMSQKYMFLQVDNLLLLQKILVMEQVIVGVKIVIVLI